MANKKKLEAEPETIAAAIMESATRKEAAQRLGVSDRSLYEYMKDFRVQAIVTALRADQLRQRMEALDESTKIAVQTLTDMLTSEEATNGDKLKAAQIILSAGAAARSSYTVTEAQAVNRLQNAQRLENERHGLYTFDLPSFADSDL